MATPLCITFARLCRDTRTMLDITQRELAAAVGVSRSHIASIETGRVDPRWISCGRSPIGSGSICS